MGDKQAPLAIYLRNHEAAARAGCDLFTRVARSHRSEAYAGELDALRRESRRTWRRCAGSCAAPRSRRTC